MLNVIRLVFLPVILTSSLARDDEKEKTTPKTPTVIEQAPRPRPQSMAHSREDSPAPDSKAKAAAEVTT